MTSQGFTVELGIEGEASRLRDRTDLLIDGVAFIDPVAFQGQH